MSDIKKLLLYTGGITRGNGFDSNLGGYGIVAAYSDKPQEYSYKGFRNTPKGTIELQAIIHALKHSKGKGYVTEIYSDSSYIIDCINQKWFINWYDNGWVTKDKKPVKNRELWIELIELLKEIPFVKFAKTDESNEEVADLIKRLSNKAIEGL